MVTCDKCSVTTAVGAPYFTCVGYNEHYCSVECANRMATPLFGEGNKWRVVCHICDDDD